MDGTQKFSGKAEVYERARPRYPAALYHFLSDELKMRDGCTVADIGSGTGIFLRPLLEQGCQVTGVEPNGDMRRQAEQRLNGNPRFHSLCGTAEHTGLPDRCVDFVTAAQAFHWFDADAFRTECRRILRPGGHVVLLWNTQEDRDPLACGWDAVYRKFCPDFSESRSGRHIDEKEKLVSQFFGDRFLSRHFPNNQTCGHRSFLERSLSTSYSLKKGDKGYGEYILALDALFRRFENGGIIEISYQTHVYFGAI